MSKCHKVKNPCKICLGPVTQKNGLQCHGACETWVHYGCLNYTPGRIKDIKAGVINVTCPCPDCKTILPKEYRQDDTYSCTNIECPANRPPRCVNIKCPVTENEKKSQTLGYEDQGLGNLAHIPGFGPQPPSYSIPTNDYGVQAPSAQNPCYLPQTPGYGPQSPGYGQQSPGYGPQPPDYGTQPDDYGFQAPSGFKKCGVLCKEHIMSNQRIPVQQIPDNSDAYSDFKRCASNCSTNVDVLGDTNLNQPYPSLETMEEMCKTIGLLSTQMNKMMTKMRNVTNSPKDKHAGCSPANQNCCSLPGPKSQCPKPCNCPDNPGTNKRRNM